MKQNGELISENIEITLFQLNYNCTLCHYLQKAWQII
jgi:hypothetical protein